MCWVPAGLVLPSVWSLPLSTAAVCRDAIHTDTHTHTHTHTQRLSGEGFTSASVLSFTLWFLLFRHIRQVCDLDLQKVLPQLHYLREISTRYFTTSNIIP